MERPICSSVTAVTAFSSRGGRVTCSELVKRPCGTGGRDDDAEATAGAVAAGAMRAGSKSACASAGESDLMEAAKTAIINKRAGGTGLISGRKAFQKPMADGVKLLNTIQDIYLSQEITIA